MKKTILLALSAAVLFILMTPSSYAYEFSKTEQLREDGRISAVCTWDYGTMKTHHVMDLGTCFEDHLNVGDSGYRFPDGTAPWQYADYVGYRHADKDLSIWKDVAVEERAKAWEIRQEELKVKRNLLKKDKLQQQMEDLQKELQALADKFNLINN